jgi:hypothetical protein
MKLTFDIKTTGVTRISYTVQESDKIEVERFLKKHSMQFADLFSQLAQQLKKQDK